MNDKPKGTTIPKQRLGTLDMRLRTSSNKEIKMGFKEKWANLDNVGKWAFKVFFSLVILFVLITAAVKIF